MYDRLDVSSSSWAMKTRPDDGARTRPSLVGGMPGNNTADLGSGC